ncbi:MAG: hypothetical protein H6645_02130 [Caldilineaceae bacterium]|nr:hypothetical protein [Caldilineaceae bacterium]
MLLWRKIPFTLVIFASILLLGIVLGSVRGYLAPAIEQQWGFGLHNLWDGRPYTIVTSVFLTRRPFMVLGMVTVVGSIVGVYEWLVGWRRALLLFWTTDFLSKLMASLLVVWPLYLAGTEMGRSMALSSDIGASAGGRDAWALCCTMCRTATDVLSRSWLCSITLSDPLSIPILTQMPCTSSPLALGWYLGRYRPHISN